MTPTNSASTSTLQERLSNTKGALIWNSVLLVIIGLVALAYPVFMTQSVNFLVGLSYIGAGLVGIVGAFHHYSSKFLLFIGALLVNLLKIAIGVFIIAFPQASVLVLTILVAAAFLIESANQFVMALELIPSLGRGLLILSAFVSGTLGLIIALGLPGTSAYTLGVCLGIALISSGVASAVIGFNLDADENNHAI